MKHRAVLLIVAIGLVPMLRAQEQYGEELLPLLKGGLAGVSTWGLGKLLDRAVVVVFPKTDGQKDYNRALDYQYGRNGMPRDSQKAFDFFEKSAKEEWSPSQCIVGDHYYDIKDYGSALHWYVKAADHNHAHALYRLAVLYDNGLGVPRSTTIAISYLKQAADHDQPAAQALYMMGCMLYLGKGVQQDYTSAANYFERAANQGHHPAEIAIGYCYATGRGRPQDSAEAMRYYKAAARWGDPVAQFGMGWIYQHETLPDICNARHWYALAAHNGNEPAKQALQRLPSYLLCN